MAVITENDLDLAEAFCRAARANLDVATKFLPARPLFSCAPVNKPTRVMIVIENMVVVIVHNHKFECRAILERDNKGAQSNFINEVCDLYGRI